MLLLTLTQDEINQIRTRDTEWGSVFTHADRAQLDRRKLLDELDALRRLPVISSCGGCTHCVDVSEYHEPCAWHCHHPLRTVEVGVVDGELPPPDWCPLRGKP